MTSMLRNRRNGVWCLTEPRRSFEDTYLRVRRQEGRVYDDELVRRLPDVPPQHPHAAEWEIRNATAERFTAYLRQKPPGELLDIGCGNGWFSQKIAPLASRVYGLDVGMYELEQAARCSNEDNVEYICCDDWHLLPDSGFNLIVFNASFQYFTLTADFWLTLKRCLKERGEIHILDTRFYDRAEVAAARQRSQQYFSELGFSGAADYYHHHSWSDLPEGFEIRVAAEDSGASQAGLSPFPWVVLGSL